MRRMTTMIGLVALGAGASVLAGMSTLNGATSSPARTAHDDDDADGWPVLVVGGEGRVTKAPDTVVISFGAIARGEKAGDAQQQVNDAVDRAVRNIKAMALENMVVQTTQLSLYPIYDNSKRNENPRITGYQAQLGVEVRTTSLDKASAVIDKGLDAGLNNFNGISFTLDNDRAARMEALAAAASDAKMKAGVLAEKLGIQLGAIQLVQESTQGVRPPMAYQMRGMVAMDSMEGAGATVESGTLDVRASVTITYRIKQ